MRQLTPKGAVLILLAVFALAADAAAQQASPYAEKIKIFGDFVKNQMETDRIPGLTIGFMKDDFIWTQGYGYADLEHRTPATASTAYRLASNTKSMTAVAILQLVEKGNIDLDRDVRTYVPYFPKKRWPVTVRLLLGHLGGISHYRDYDVEGHIKEHRDTQGALDIFAGFDLVAEPGTKYTYSSYGYNLLGAVIEGASKQSYGDYLREHLWNPLGMNDTHMDDPNEIIPNRVQGYRIINGEIRNSEFIDISSRFAAGGTLSTVVDLLKYAKGLESEKVLSRKSVQLMQTSMATKDGYSIDYGMGWRLTPVNGRFQVSHTGSQAETRTLLVRFPKEHFAMALAYNLEGANRHVYSRRLFQLIFNEPWDMRVYTGNRIDDALVLGLSEVFNYGLSYFDRHEMAQTEEAGKLTEAFAYFNAYVNRRRLASDYAGTPRKIEQGRHPAAKESFVKVGSYMALKLHEKSGSRGMDVYHKMGAITFFNDFLELYESDPDYPEEFRFSRELEKTIVQWAKDWENTCSDYVRQLTVSPFSDLGTIGKRLKKSFSRSKIYPDFSGELADVVRYQYIKGDRQKAYRAANLATDLYPRSSLPFVVLGNAYICFGETDKGRKTYKKALEIDPDDESVHPGSFIRYAVDLASNAKLDEAMELLKIAVELYPNDARLYNSVAEIHLEKGKEYYQKALKLDPTFGPARDRLKKIQ